MRLFAVLLNGTTLFSLLPSTNTVYVARLLEFDSFRFISLPQGFSDHVPPPVGVPSPDNLTYTETAADGKKYTFNFTRLGVRCVSI